MALYKHYRVSPHCLFCAVKFFVQPGKVFVKFTPQNKRTPNYASVFQEEKCIHCASKYSISRATYAIAVKSVSAT